MDFFSVLLAMLQFGLDKIISAGVDAMIANKNAMIALEKAGNSMEQGGQDLQLLAKNFDAMIPVIRDSAIAIKQQAMFQTIEGLVIVILVMVMTWKTFSGNEQFKRFYEWIKSKRNGKYESPI